MMGEHYLPNGWAISAIQNLVATDGLISDGDWVESKDQDPNGSVRLVQLADIGDGNFRNKSQRLMSEDRAALLNCTFLQQGDVLIARMPDPLGRACLFPGVGQPAVTVVDICLIRTGLSAALTNRLLKYWVNSPDFRGLIAENASGTTRKRITRKKLEKFEFPLPSLSEQKVIADKLDTLLAQVDNTKARLERIPKILKRFRQSVLAAAVSGRLTDEWRRGRPNNPSWVALRLGALIKNGPQNGIYKPLKLYGSGSLIIRIDSFYDGQISCWGKLKRVKIEAAEIEKWQVHQGDLLINRVNSIEYLGKSALVGELSEPAVFESNIMRLSLDRAKAAPEFISLFLRSPAGIAQLRSNAKLAVNQASINQGDVKNCSMELPGLDEQTEIVRRVDQLFVHADHLEQQVNNAMARVGNLTQSILTKAFRGELTEQWRENNPELISGDNSADKLLERIQAELAATNHAKAKGRKTDLA
jgi:type I restriction enzyme S subunit